MDLDKTKLIRFEQGELDEEESLEIIEGMVQSGEIYNQSGMVQKRAIDLVDAGLCADRFDSVDDGEGGVEHMLEDDAYLAGLIT